MDYTDPPPDGEDPRGPERREISRLPGNRLVTMMFVDLVGSTHIAQGYSLEQGFAIIEKFREAVLRAVAVYGGHLRRTEGDGMLFAFGDPVARADDPERGVLAALEAHRELRALEGREGITYRTRIGISTTLVLVEGEESQKRLHGEGFHGLGPILARRLQDIAGQNNTVICNATWERVKDQFKVERLRQLEFKNFNAPVEAWRVLGELPGAARLRQIVGPPKSELIGRQAELDQLMQAWESVRTDGMRIVLLSGSPGIGKSRLLSDHRNHPALGRHNSLVYKCMNHYERTPYFPFVSQMELWMGIRSGDSAATREAKLNAKMGPVMDDGPLKTLAALLAPNGEGAKMLETTPAEVFQKQVVSAFIASMRALARDMPALIHFEDIHWIDPSSRKLLMRALPALRDLPILLVASHHPNTVPEFGELDNIDHLTLGSLEAGHAQRMVRSLDTARALEDHTVARIAQVTQGVPLFIEHFVPMILSGKLDAAELGKLDEPTQIPEQILGLLFERLDDTGPDKGVALAATAIGRPFDTALLAAAAGMPPEDTQAVIDRLLHRGILRRSRSDAELPYQFDHILLLDAGYKSMVSRHQEILHERIARHLADERPELAQQDPGLLARQFRRAGIHDRAIEMSLKAGNRALSRFAYPEARMHAERALKQLVELPDDARARPAMHLQQMYGIANAALRGYGDKGTLDAFTKAFDLASEQGDAKTFLRAAQGLFAAYHAHANYDLAGSFGHKIRQRIAASGSTLDTARARSFADGITGAALIWQGAFRQAHETLNRALGAEEDAGPGRTDASAHQTLASLALVEAFRGNADSATKLSSDAIATARISGSPMAICNAMLMSCNAHQILRHADALKQARDLERYADQQNLPFYKTGARAFVGVALYQDEDRIEEGYELLNASWQLFRKTTSRANQVFVCVERAEGCRLMDRPQDGLDAIQEGLVLAEQFGERNFEAELHRLRGALMVELGDNSDAALDHIHRGRAIARAQGAVLFELRAETELAEQALADRADPAHLDALATLVADWPEDDSSPDLARAKAVLARADAALPLSERPAVSR